MDLNSKQIKRLKGMAHSLSPLLTVGKEALSEGLLIEADACLEHHQLVKAKIHCEDREEFQGLSLALAEATESSLVGTIGRIAIYFRPPRKAETKIRVQV